MDERAYQLKEMKKAYKKVRARAVRKWKIPAVLFLLLCLLFTAVSVFVLAAQWAPVVFVDNQIWEPMKAKLNLGLDYGLLRQLAESYAAACAAAAGLLFILFTILWGHAAAKTKKTDAYLNYHTLMLTLKTEKEEN